MNIKDWVSDLRKSGLITDRVSSFIIFTTTVVLTSGFIFSLYKGLLFLAQETQKSSLTCKYHISLNYNIYCVDKYTVENGFIYFTEKKRGEKVFGNSFKVEDKRIKS